MQPTIAFQKTVSLLCGTDNIDD